MREIVWIGSSQEDLRAFPERVQIEIAVAIEIAAEGRKAVAAKPLTGGSAFKGATVMEIVERHDGDTYRAVYTVKVGDAVYVLHAFQKKSKQGRATPQKELDLIRRRLKLAAQDAAGRLKGK